MARASARSSVGVVADVVVRATQRSPSTSWATRSRKVESTPPENATSAESIAPSRLCNRWGLSPSVTLDALGLEERCREIAFAGVAEDRQDDGSTAEPAGDPDCRRAVRPRRDADQQTLVARERPCVLGRLLVAHREDLVVDLGVQILGHEARTDPLDAVKARLAAGEHGRCGGLHRRDPDVRLPVAQDLTGSGDGATRADAGDERVDRR